MDDLEINGPADKTRINIDQVHEVRYWTRTLGCTVIQLQTAVSEVGVMVADVKTYLYKKKTRDTDYGR